MENKDLHQSPEADERVQDTVQIEIYLRYFDELKKSHPENRAAYEKASWRLQQEWQRLQDDKELAGTKELEDAIKVWEVLDGEFPELSEVKKDHPAA